MAASRYKEEMLATCGIGCDARYFVLNRFGNPDRKKNHHGFSILTHFFKTKEIVVCLGSSIVNELVVAKTRIMYCREQP